MSRIPVPGQPFDALVDHSHGRRGRSGVYSVVVMVVVVLSALLASGPSAAQEPPRTPTDEEVFSAEPVVVTAPWPITPPAFKDVPKPEYPDMARHRGWEGTVLLLLQVRSDGTVGEVKIRQPSGKPILDEAAARAATHWTFNPAMRGPKSVEVWLEVPVKFELR